MDTSKKISSKNKQPKETNKQFKKVLDQLNLPTYIHQAALDFLKDPSLYYDPETQEVFKYLENLARVGENRDRVLKAQTLLLPSNQSYRFMILRPDVYMQKIDRYKQMVRKQLKEKLAQLPKRKVKDPVTGDITMQERKNFNGFENERNEAVKGAFEKICNPEMRTEVYPSKRLKYPKKPDKHIDFSSETTITLSIFFYQFKMLHGFDRPRYLDMKKCYEKCNRIRTNWARAQDPQNLHDLTDKERKDRERYLNMLSGVHKHTINFSIEESAIPKIVSELTEHPS